MTELPLEMLLELDVHSLALKEQHLWPGKSRYLVCTQEAGIGLTAFVKLPTISGYL